MLQRSYFCPSAATFCCDQMKQHLKHSREAIFASWPPMFFISQKAQYLRCHKDANCFSWPPLFVVTKAYSIWYFSEMLFLSTSHQWMLWPMCTKSCFPQNKLLLKRFNLFNIFLYFCLLSISDHKLNYWTNFNFYIYFTCLLDSALFFLKKKIWNLVTFSRLYSWNIEKY